jgi:hypothetical protein
MPKHQVRLLKWTVLDGFRPIKAAVACGRAVFTRRMGALALVFLVGGCAYRGAVDTVPTIRFTWFSYLNGDDIREACTPGSPFHYRLVYNADYDKQLRSYALVSDGGEGLYFVARAMVGFGIDISELSLQDPLGLGGWQRVGERLDAVALAEIDHALEWSGAFEPAPNGLRLYSDQYYWVAALCHQGKFYFNAWLYPSNPYDRLSFPELLFAHDRTGVPVAPPRDVGPAARMKGATKGRKPNQIFQIRVGENGLVGLAGI